MLFRHQFPVVRLLIPLLAGIITAIALSGIQFFLVPVLLAAIFMVPVWMNIIARKPQYRSRWVFGVLVSLILFLFGYNLLVLNKEILHKSHFSTFKASELLAVVVDPPREKEHSWKLVLKVMAVKQNRQFVPVKGQLLAYLAKDSSLQLPVYGDMLILRAIPSNVSPPANPGMFDYRQYLSRNNIYQQVYLKKGSWKTIGPRPGFSARGLAFELRRHFLVLLHQNRLDGKEYAVAAALILGQDEILDYETRHEYSSAGVMHILGISGLHVGIIYMVLNILFGFLDKKQKGRLIKVMLILTLIWLYALITGLSPAALRAATMFTFVSFGNLLKRNVHIINSLAISAFALLLYDPYLVTNIGFQFSYIAVIGIVLLHKELYELWEPRAWLADQAWSLVAMSLVAQFVTFPITLYYFHQFPVYFLAANLVAIPLSNTVIYTGMAVLGTSFLPPLSNLIGLITSWLLKALNISVRWIENLPYSVIPDIPLNFVESLLLYIMIIASAAYVLTRRKSLVFVSLAAISSMFSSQALRSYQHHQQEKMIVFSVNKHSAIEYISGTKCLLVADSILLNDRKLLDFNISCSRSLYGLDETRLLSQDTLTERRKRYFAAGIPVMIDGHFMQAGNTRLAIIDNLPLSKTFHQPLKVDYLVIRGNPALKIGRLIHFYSAGTIIFDATNSFSKCKRWETECKQLGIRSWNLKNSGAFIADL